MRLNIPPNYTPERTYITQVILKEFLGLDYKLEVSESAVHPYMISWEGKKLIFTQDFFPENEAETYLDKKYFPQNVHSYEDVLVLYGKPNIEWSDTEVRCDVDLFGAAFFMLTRWEEYVRKEIDQHERFYAPTSTAWQLDFLQRPVVNEYTDLLWKMLRYLGLPQSRKKWSYQLLPMHDVDLPRLWWSTKDKLRSLGGSLFKRKSITEFALLSKYILQQKDPFDTFDYLMQRSEAKGWQSHFFFMAGGTSIYDNHYKIEHPVLQDLLKEVDARGHKIGFHPSYNAYKDAEQFGQELERLQAASPQEIKTGRQHFLRFEVPKTWQIWEQYNMEWDSTMGYAEQIGFRCGVCYPFTVFDVLQRKTLRLKERPLLAMDVSLQQYQSITPEAADAQLQDLIKTVQQYGGEMTLLWHNSSFNLPQWKGYEVVYENCLSLKS